MLACAVGFSSVMTTLQRDRDVDNPQSQGHPCVMLVCQQNNAQASNGVDWYTGKWCCFNDALIAMKLGVLVLGGPISEVFGCFTVN